MTAMRIVMFTNTYLPHVGGVARSVSTLEEELRRRGHQVWVVAPEFEDATDSTSHVLRVPAVQRFNGSDFSFSIPQPGLVADFIQDVQPHIVHSHHPFLLGDTALRVGWTQRLPVVFTHHTLYEQYTHYVPLDSDALKRVVVQMVTEYANLCSHVVAPSQSIAEMLVQRGVTTPTTVIPTGIDMEQFGSGDSAAFRQRFHIPAETLVVGHVGRLAGEKNLAYLARAVGRFLSQRPDAVFVVVGTGEEAELVENTIGQLVDPARVVMTGSLTGPDLLDAYAAMDVFVFSSQSETQGMVLVEAMAARAPVVAIDGPGVRDVLHGGNGRLLPADASEDEFANALHELTRDKQSLRQLGESARESVTEYGLAACADRMLALYEDLVARSRQAESVDLDPWDQLRRRLTIEWNLLVEKTTALSAALVETEATKDAG